VGLACDADYEIPDSFFEPLPDELLKAFNGELPDPMLDGFAPDEPLLKAAEARAVYKVGKQK
jgi:hypothetical protein